MGRPRKYATDADRQAAFRASEDTVRLEVRVSAQLADSITQLSESYDVSKNEVMNALFRFALRNRNWKRFGVPKS